MNKPMLRKIAGAVAALFVLLSFPVAALAYTTPFDPPDAVDYAAPGEPAVLDYRLREGGTFLYCNNPETIKPDDVDKVLMLEKNVHGDVYFTAEHINQAGRKVFFGLQLRNKSGKPITVTVKNIGYQAGGDWCGQTEWSDFFGVTYDIQQTDDEFHFTEVKKPQIFTETTYTIPNGKYFYVCGGSTYDAYDNINVGNSANKPVDPGKVLNAACYFTVDGPAKGVEAAFVCYRSASFPVTSSEPQGYVCVRKENGIDVEYGLQYQGSAPYLCAECAMAWEVDDSVADGRLQTAYKTNYFKDAQYNSYIPYAKYKEPLERNVKMYGWKTHLNVNWDSSYVGTDMMPFTCINGSGKTVTIDQTNNDGTGKAANIGNWMVVYEERLSFKNSGSTDRTFTVNMSLHGILAMNVKNGDGELLRTYYHSNAGEVYTLTVPAGEEGELLLEYTLTANSYGGITHAVVLGTAEPEPDEPSEEASEPEESSTAEESDSEPSGAESEPEEETSEFVVTPLKDDSVVNTWVWIVIAFCVLIGACAAFLGIRTAKQK